MATLTRAFDWSKTSIGAPENWPQSLRSTLSIILPSKFPMFLWWGPDLIQFYNDAYRCSLGNEGKHPDALGQRGEECWPEIWPVIKPLIDQVMAGGESTWSEDQLIPIYRNGILEDVYWTFGYSPVQGLDGKIEGVLVICNETTEKVRNVQKLLISDQRFQTLVHGATVGIIILMGDDMVVEVVNDAYCGLVSRARNELLNQPLFQIIPEAEDSFRHILEKVRTCGEAIYLFSHPYFVLANSEKKEGYLDLVYQPYKESDGTTTGVMVLCHDVTEQVTSKKRIQESVQQISSVVEAAPFPIGVYVGKEMRIQFANQSIKETWGKGDDVVGKLFAEVLPELSNQEIFSQLDSVFNSGIAFHAKNQRVDLYKKGKLDSFYFNYSLTPLFDADGNVYGVMNTAADVSDLNLAHKKLEESEQNLRNIILQAPVAMCILRGENQVVEIANERMLELWGRGKDEMIGNGIFDALPEVKNHGLEDVLNNVFTTGKTFSAYGLPVTLPRNDQVETVYINFVYEAFKEGDGKIAGIMAVATDVTQQVVATKKIEESEARFRLMADTMPQFVWRGDAMGKLDYFNQAVYNYSGLTAEEVRENGWLQIVHSDERDENIQAWMHSINTGEDFTFQHRFKNSKGEYRWQLSRAVAQKNEDGKVQLWIGTSTDIHDQKLFEEELNRQVNERTLALKNNNKELARSNANLQEFAYAASHDLKEPIRKIHFFTDRLKQEYSSSLSKDGVKTLERLEVASDRMRILVDDLLDYSQVSRGANEFENIDLNKKLELVLGDLEMAIQEKTARISIDVLPTIKGHRRQMQQLFQNLIGNAVKYSRHDAAPEITIKSKTIVGANAGIPLNEEDTKAQFHFIEISDNGIGFDQKDAERIFQVFTRLHGNAEYRGTGVGLSIARKVVDNHNGFIYAKSEPGKGATFCIGLPV